MLLNLYIFSSLTIAQKLKYWELWSALKNTINMFPLSIVSQLLLKWLHDWCIGVAFSISHKHNIRRDCITCQFIVQPNDWDAKSWGNWCFVTIVWSQMWVNIPNKIKKQKEAAINYIKTSQFGFFRLCSVLLAKMFNREHITNNTNAVMGQLHHLNCARSDIKYKDKVYK